MADNFVGEVRCVGFQIAPKGWTFCNGQIMSIVQNTALFSLLGIQYGGDGRVTFGLPNLQNSVAMGQGQGPGLSDRVVGEQGGASSVTLIQQEMPLHNHTYRVNIADGPADQTSPSAASSISVGPAMFNAGGPLTQMAPNMLPVVGGSNPHNNMMPFLTLNFIIALQGIFPQRQ